MRSVTARRWSSPVSWSTSSARACTAATRWPRTRARRLDDDVRALIVDATVRITRALDVRGLCNIQFAVHRGIPHVLEVNPRASRTVPFLSKVTGVPMVELATRVMRGAKLCGAGLDDRARRRIAAAGRGQGAGVLDREAHRRRYGARSGDEVDRRGDGHRHRPRRRAREGLRRGARGRARRAAARSAASPTSTRRRRCRSSRSSARSASPSTPRREPRLRSRSAGISASRGRQDRSRAAQRHRRDRGRPGVDRPQHRLELRHRRAGLRREEGGVRRSAARSRTGTASGSPRSSDASRAARRSTPPPRSSTRSAATRRDRAFEWPRFGHTAKASSRR